MGRRGEPPPPEAAAVLQSQAHALRLRGNDALGRPHHVPALRDMLRARIPASHGSVIAVPTRVHTCRRAAASLAHPRSGAGRTRHPNEVRSRRPSSQGRGKPHQTVGIDISKDCLDAFAAPEGRSSRFSNDRAGLRKLIAWFGSGVDRIAYEPSGPFHRDLEDTLLKAGLPLYAINPFQVRSFARSLGQRAKTDAVDARMLAIMAAAVEDLRPTEARSEGQRDLTELQQIRDAISDGFRRNRAFEFGDPDVLVLVASASGRI